MRRTLQKMAAVMLLAMLACVTLSGCLGGTRTVYVPPGQAVRLRKTIKKAEVWALDKDHKEVPGTIDLPEGWFALPDSGAEAKDAKK